MVRSMKNSVSNATSNGGGERKSSTAGRSKPFELLLDENDSDNCCACGEQVIKNGIWCDRCTNWVHGKKECSGLKQTEYESLTKLNVPFVKYFCPKCVKEIEEDGDFDGKLCKVEKKLDRIMEGMRTKQREEKELEKKIESIVEKKVRDVTQEKEERKERDDNLVIAGIPECSGTEEEQKNHDREHIDAILKTAIGSIGENEDM